MKKRTTIVIGIFLFTILLFFIFIASGLMFVKYESKCELIFDNKEIKIGANYNNFLISYDDKKVKQDYMISNDGKQLLLITALDILTSSNEKIIPVIEFQSDGTDYSVFILERDKEYYSQNKNKMGVILMNQKKYYIDEKEIERILEIVKSWNETDGKVSVETKEDNEKYMITIESSKFLIDMTKGDMITNYVSLESGTEQDSFIYVDVIVENYGNCTVEKYIIDSKTFNDFMNYLSEVIG